jgi:subtilisin family serine protease
MGNQPPCPLNLVGLPALMALTSGRSEIRIGLIDGPVATKHPDFANRLAPLSASSTCLRAESAACRHGTFVAGVLAAQRQSPTPGICPECTILVRAIFTEEASPETALPTASPAELADAITDCIRAGARILNLSIALGRSSLKEERLLQGALDQALGLGVVVIAAAGNQGTIGSTVITRHPATIPVVAYDAKRRPMDNSNIGASIGRKGLGGPGDRVISLGTHGRPVARGGTSAAAPFITGTAALL